MHLNIQGNNNVIVTLMLPHNLIDKKINKINHALNHLETLINMRNKGLLSEMEYKLMRNILIMEI